MADLMFIENPASRRGRSRARKVRRWLAAREGAGAGGALWADVGDLERCDPPRGRVIAVGGDGTINAAASWLLERGASVPLAVIPAGTGNNLARGLGIPLDLPRACSLALGGSACADLDVIRYRTGADDDGRLLIQSAALGFPAEIASLYARLRRGRIFRALAAPAGTYVYRILALAGLVRQRWRERRGWRGLSVRIRLGEEAIEDDALAIFIGNERSLGGEFHPCPRARPDDGRLDLCIVRSCAAEPYLRIFAAIARGEHLDLGPSIVYRQSEGPLEMRLSAPSPLLADGDLWVESDAYRMEVCPGRLRVVIPGP
ncbi:MAG: hypothetical protein JXA90_16125 [Planctomycetes bacterium]|nr:hypothetical protein [Planctomycetota bacterium]